MTEEQNKLADALEPFAKYGEVAKRNGTCGLVGSIRQRIGDGPEETLAEISVADCIKASEVREKKRHHDSFSEFAANLLGLGYALVQFMAFLLPLAFLLLIGFLFGRIT